ECAGLSALFHAEKTAAKRKSGDKSPHSKSHRSCECVDCQRFFMWGKQQQKEKAATSRRTPKYYRSTFSSVRNNTFAPFSMSFGRENSFGEWLMPPTLGIKIMPTGARRAMSCAS